MSRWLVTGCAGFIGYVDGVFHLAAQLRVCESWGERFVMYLHDNVLTQRVFETAVRRRIRLLFASSLSRRESAIVR